MPNHFLSQVCRHYFSSRLFNFLMFNVLESCFEQGGDEEEKVPKCVIRKKKTGLLIFIDNLSSLFFLAFFSLFQ